MSFLSKLSALKKTTPVNNAPLVINKPKSNSDEPESLLPKRYVRDEDPAVKRLKELRRKEQMKNGELLKKKTGSTAARKPRGESSNKRKADEDGDSVGTVYKKRIGASTRHDRPKDMNSTKRREPIKKMTFEELMKQAEQNNKPAVTAKPSSKPPHQTPAKFHKPGFKSRTTGSKINNDQRQIPREPVHNRMKSTSTPHHNETLEKPVKISLPTNKFAQPNSRIKQRLEKKGYKTNHHQRDRYGGRVQEEEEVDSELDDFIEDDEEEADMDDRYRSSRKEAAGYDRDEIWAMFNKGRGRSHYRDDYDDEDEDDMEANEMEILEEEEYATKMARLEDKKEEVWLKKHEAEKKKLKKRF